MLYYSHLPDKILHTALGHRKPLRVGHTEVFFLLCFFPLLLKLYIIVFIFEKSLIAWAEFLALLFNSCVIWGSCLTPLFFPGSSELKASACNEGDLGLIPGLGRSPGEGNGNPLQYSCLENPMDGGAWWATVHGVAKSRTRLSDFTHSLSMCFKLMLSWHAFLRES